MSKWQTQYPLGTLYRNDRSTSCKLSFRAGSCVTCHCIAQREILDLSDSVGFYSVGAGLVPALLRATLLRAIPQKATTLRQEFGVSGSTELAERLSRTLRVRPYTPSFPKELKSFRSLSQVFLSLRSGSRVLLRNNSNKQQKSPASEAFLKGRGKKEESE